MKLFQPGKTRLAARSSLLVIGLMAVVAVTSACGSSSSSSSATTTSTTVASSGANSGARTQFTSCLESHGVPASAATSLFGGRRAGAGGTGGAPGGSIPSGSTPPGSFPTGSFPRTTIPSQYQAAFTACRSLLPNRGSGGFNSTAFATYENCLRANGVTIPTTTTVAGGTGGGFGGGGFGGGGFQALSSQPAYAAAAQKCASLRPSFGPGGGGTTTTVPAA